MTSRFRNSAYWHQHRAVEPEAMRGLGDTGLRRALAAGEPGRVRGDDVEDHVRDHRDGEEEHDGPEKAPDQVAEHGARLYRMV